MCVLYPLACWHFACGADDDDANDDANDVDDGTQHPLDRRWHTWTSSAMRALYDDVLCAYVHTHNYYNAELVIPEQTREHARLRVKHAPKARMQWRALGESYGACLFCTAFVCALVVHAEEMCASLHDAWPYQNACMLSVCMEYGAWLSDRADGEINEPPIERGPASET